jgi:hypothetical protein
VPGSKNKRQAELTELIKATGFDPLQALCEVGNNALASDNSEMVFACAKELMPYLHPKKKAIEVTGVDAAPVDFHVTIGGPLTLSDSLQLIQDAADGPLPDEAAIEHEPPEPVVVDERPPLMDRHSSGVTQKPIERDPPPPSEPSPAEKQADDWFTKPLY